MVGVAGYFSLQNLHFLAYTGNAYYVSDIQIDGYGTSMGKIPYLEFSDLSSFAALDLVPFLSCPARRWAHSYFQPVVGKLLLKSN
jgi:hypothetical protein